MAKLRAVKLVISRNAARRVREISDYVHAQNPRAALSVRRRLQETFALLASRPLIGRRVQDPIRRFALARLPYVVLYRVDATADEVTILTVRHTAQEAP